MLRKLTFSAFFAAAICANAQSSPADTTAVDSISLGEVTVTAAPVIRKADRDIYVPDAQIKGKSSDGLTLLKNMQIPSLFVDNVMDKINAGGNDVQLRINGREASLRDVKALQPESVVRIEYMDDPGLRYKGATNVLNFIVRNPTLGGSLMLQALNTLSRENLTNGFISTKLNSGRSQWGLDAFVNSTSNFDSKSHSFTQYSFPNQTTITRNSNSIDGKFGNTWAYFNLYYNYLVTDKTNIYVQAQSGFQPRNKNSVRELMTEDIVSRATKTLESSDTSTSRANYPSLNFYFDRKLPRNQTVVFSLTTGWRIEKSNTIHSEFNPLESSVRPDSYKTNTRVGNFDITGELNYIKEWKQTQLTAGANYYQAWLRTHYYSPVSQLLKQRMQNIYFFAEVTQKFKTVTLTAGLGAEHMHQVSGNTSPENEMVWRPRFSASWRANDHNRIGLTFNASSSQPSLNQLSDVWTQSNPYLGSIGNPNLKSNMNYSTRLNYQYTLPKFQLQFDAEWLRSPGAIVSYYYYDDIRNLIVSSYSNSSGNRMRFAISPRITVIPNWITVSGRLQFQRSFWHGPDYNLSQSSFNGNYNASITHWDLTLTFQGFLSPKHLEGQNINRGERIHMIFLSYKYKRFNFAAGVFNPYGRHNFLSETKSRNYNSQSVQSIANHPFAIVSVNYNLQWGRQKNQGRRLINGPSQPSSDSKTVGM